VFVLEILGGVLVSAGLFGLGYCIWTGYRIRRSALPPARSHAQLRTLVAVNLGSVALATLGLMLLFLGLSF
jgi:hypothetical protein